MICPTVRRDKFSGTCCSFFFLFTKRWFSWKLDKVEECRVSFCLFFFSKEKKKLNVLSELLVRNPAPPTAFLLPYLGKQHDFRVPRSRGQMSVRLSAKHDSIAMIQSASRPPAKDQPRAPSLIYEAGENVQLSRMKIISLRIRHAKKARHCERLAFHDSSTFASLMPALGHNWADSRLIDHVSILSQICTVPEQIIEYLLGK